MMKTIGGIFLGIGANLAADGFASPRAGCLAAIDRLGGAGVEVLRLSPWYRTPPEPPSGQPWYDNAVLEVDSRLTPQELLATLHDIEQGFGRLRHTRNEARVLDMDILDYRGLVQGGDAIGADKVGADKIGAGKVGVGADKVANLTLPHPRMHLRGFVLKPLADIAPDWIHPISHTPIKTLIARLDSDDDMGT